MIKVKIKKYKYPILTIVLVCVILSSFMLFKKPKYSLSKLESKGIISYTIDGASATEKPSKNSGYVVNTITCANGSNLVWDNDNWLVEIVSLESYDNCLIDFTKDLSKSGTRVTLIKGDNTEITENYKDEITFEYNGTDGSDGSVQTFTAPATGDYTLEAWGGQGGNGYISASSTLAGAYGGYSKGTVSLNAGDILYIYVGGKGKDGDSTTTAKTGGYNGGGNGSGNGKGGAGGGSTHIATTEGLLSTLSSSTTNILLVAGGGGGSAGYTGYKGGNGGGTSGTAGTSSSTRYAAGAGTQTSGGAGAGYNTKSAGDSGTFGKGGNAHNYNSAVNYSGGGGSGYYGGGGGGYRSGTAKGGKDDYRYTSGGGGGSSFIKTSLTNTYTSSQTSYTGNGKAIISYDITNVETIFPSKVNMVLDTTSKTTTYGGTVTYYLKDNAKFYRIDNCPNAIIKDNKIIFENVTENITCTIIGKSSSVSEGGLVTQILKDNPTISKRTDFSTTNSAITTGTIYQTIQTENGSMVYYYSGSTTNNWVKFGKYTQDDTSSNSLWKSGDDMYWRIIRTNEDGSIRLLYSGTSPDTTTGYIGSSKYNTIYTDPMYVGYMYGTSGTLAKNRANTNDSTIKTTIDTWYQNSLFTNYDKYISKTAIYCNDRSIGSGSYSTSDDFYFGAWTRLKTNKTPTYKCGGDGNGGLFASSQAIADKFSASTEGGGNGQLTYPIAMMTADEISFAGGMFGGYLVSPNYAWYYSNSAVSMSITGTGDWRLLTPCSWSNTLSSVLFVSGTDDIGYMVGTNVTHLKVIRPVISLKACTKYSSGDGTANSPYTVTIDEECSSAEN